MERKFHWSILYYNSNYEMTITLKSKAYKDLIGTINLKFDPYNIDNTYNHVLMKIQTTNQFENVGYKKKNVLSKHSTLILELNNGYDDNICVLKQVTQDDMSELESNTTVKFSHTASEFIAEEALNEMEELYSEIIGNKIINVIQKKMFQLKGL